MIRIAVTGGIACGKSLVASFIEDEGIPVCDADDVAHAVCMKGQPATTRLAAFFGDGILGPEGAIDRRKLGKIVFEDEQKRLLLNAIVHPPVKAAIMAWLGVQAAAGYLRVAVVVPLLFEAGMEAGWDAILCVGCSPEVQLARLQARGLSEAESRARVAAQLPLETKMERSDYSIWNNGSRDELAEWVQQTLPQIEEKDG